MATRRQQAAAFHHVLKKYKMPTLGAKEDGYEGIPYYKASTFTISLMKQFRNHVFLKDKSAIKKFIKSFINETDNEAQLDNLTSLLCDRSSSEPLKEALLTSVLIGSRPLVEFVLQLFAEFPGEEYCGCSNSNAFPSHVTPLMLACFCNNYSIVECLLIRDHRIILPHRPDCVCKMCQLTSQTVSNRLLRLDTYRAISSEAFLWLATKDPLLAAINLAQDLECCIETDSDHKEIYSSLLSRVQTFSGDLIQQCRNLEEVDCVLEQPEGATLSECGTTFPRIRVGLDAHMKPLLSHMNLQMSISSRWMGAWSEGNERLFRVTGRVLRHTVGYPILAFIHAITGGTLIHSFMIPYARYLSYVTSYFLFIFAILSLRFLKKTNRGNSETSMIELFLEIYCFVYIFGQILSEFLEFSRRGMAKYFELWWRCFDFVLLYIFVGSFILWLATHTSPIPETLHRKHWVEYDPAVLYDISFGAACLMAFWRIFYFIQLHRSYGSTVISIGRCVGEVVNYFVIMGIVIISFGLGLSTILQPYSEFYTQQDDGSKKSATLTFPDVFVSVKNLFWGFFGYMNPVDYNLQVGNSGTDLSPMNHFVTRIAVELLTALYYIVTVITLLNLMVSLLVKKADEVLANENVEWKYTRVHMYLEYFEGSMAVPPPFNIIFLFTLSLRKFASGKYKLIWPDLLIKKNILEAMNNDSLSFSSYQKLLIVLFNRYRCTKFYHYRTMQQIDADDKKDNIKPHLAFLNGSTSTNLSNYDNLCSSYAS